VSFAQELVAAENGGFEILGWELQRKEDAVEAEVGDCWLYVLGFATLPPRAKSWASANVGNPAPPASCQIRN
jgi:hypothetical protein